MIKKIVMNSLIGVSLVVGSTGTVIAIIALNKTNENNSKYLNLNKTFKEIHSLYGGSNDVPEITASNIDDINKRMADNFEQLSKKIDESKEGMVEYFNEDLKNQMNAILKKFKDNINESTDRNIAQLSDEISKIVKDYRSLDERLADTKEAVATLKTNTDDKLTALQNISTSLQTQLTGLDDTTKVTLEKIKVIDKTVGRLTVKIVELNTKQSEMNSLLQRNEERIEFLKKLINKVVGDSKQNEYDIADLETRVIKLESEQTVMLGYVDDINLSIDTSVHRMDLISTTVESFKEQIIDTGTLDASNNQKLQDLQTNVVSLVTQSQTNINTFKTFRDELDGFEKTIEDLMSKNDKLQKDVNYLSEQNHKLFDEMVKMQAAIKDVNESVIKGSTMIVLNPKANDGGDMVIYDSTSAVHNEWWNESIKLNYPIINVPLLEKAKNISIILKMQDPTAAVKNFEVKAIDTYPTRGINLINGFDTAGRTTFLIDMEIHDNDLVINHLWYRKYARHWQDIKKLDQFKVILSKIQVIY